MINTTAAASGSPEAIEHDREKHELTTAVLYALAAAYAVSLFANISLRLSIPIAVVLMFSVRIWSSSGTAQSFGRSARKRLEVVAMRVVVARGIPQDHLGERLPTQPRPAFIGEQLLVRKRLERLQQPGE